MYTVHDDHDELDVVVLFSTAIVICRHLILDRSVRQDHLIEQTKEPSSFEIVAFSCIRREEDIIFPPPFLLNCRLCFETMAAQQPPVLANNQRLSIEFVVKPTEDLFLEGSLRRLPRVSRGAKISSCHGVDTVCRYCSPRLVRWSIPVPNAENSSIFLSLPPLCEAQWLEKRR